MDGALLLLLAAAAAAALYLAHCRWWPYAPCVRCDGAGKLRSPSGRSWRSCPRCKGTGKRLRIGTRFLNRSSTTRRDAR